MPQDGKFKSKRQTHGSVLILLTERKAWEVAGLAVSHRLINGIFDDS